jgi:hypothetical protein
MAQSTRLHVQLQTQDRDSWIFDNPRQVTVGHSPQASIWVLESGVGPSRLMFDGVGSRIRFRYSKDLKGTLLIGKKNVPIETVSEIGLLHRDARGEYIWLTEKVSGTVTIGGSTFRFWVTPSPTEREYPTHIRVLDLVKNAPWAFVIFLFTSLFIHGLVYRAVNMLPPPEPPDVYEVQERFARFTIPSSEYLQREFRKAEESVPGAEAKKAETEAKKEKPAGARRKGQGFISAVAASVGKKKSSAFSSLFTTDSLKEGLASALSTKGLDEVIRLSGGAGAGGRGNLGATNTKTLAGTSFRTGTAKASELTATVSGPQVARFAPAAPQVDGTLNRMELEKLVSMNAGQLRACYEQALTSNPNLAGKVTVKLVILQNGSPSQVSVADTTMPNRSLEQCIVSRISMWKFPKPTGGATPVRFPFIFSASARG